MALTQIQAQMIADAQPWGGSYDGFNIRAAGMGGATNQGAAFSNNLYYDGTNWRYIVTGEGSVVFQSSGQFAFYAAPSGTAGAIASIAVKFIVDADGSTLVRSAAGLGYGSGSGGTVTQLTSKSTAVTLNKPTGQITMHNAALGAGVPTAFVVNNSFVTANDIIVLNGANTGGANAGNYRFESVLTQAGQFVIRVTNVSGGSLSDAIQINFAIIKGAAA